MKHFRVREFAALAGVTVRTLHHYDELGLLSPAGRSSAGYRLYSERDLARLQQIATLKYLGFPLRHIAEMLAGPEFDLAASLRLQHNVLSEQQKQLRGALAALARAQSTLDAHGEPDWQDLQKLIEVMNMSEPNEAQTKWIKGHFTEEQLAELARRDTPEARERGQRDWQELIAEVEAAVHEDPTAPKAQELARRWRALVEQFTGGNAAINANLCKMYSQPSADPNAFQRPWSDAAQTFIAAAVKAQKENEAK